MEFEYKSHAVLLITDRSNSVIYATTTAYEYVAAVVTDDFFQGANWTARAREPYGTPAPTEWHAWMEDVQRGRC
jgi:type 1 glutamine amidotransferase